MVRKEFLLGLRQSEIKQAMHAVQMSMRSAFVRGHRSSFGFLFFIAFYIKKNSPWIVVVLNCKMLERHWRILFCSSKSIHCESIRFPSIIKHRNVHTITSTDSLDFSMLWRSEYLFFCYKPPKKKNQNKNNINRAHCAHITIAGVVAFKSNNKYWFAWTCQSVFKSSRLSTYFWSVKIAPKEHTTVHVSFFNLFVVITVTGHHYQAIVSHAIYGQKTN